MEYRNFEEIAQAVRTGGGGRTIAVAGAADAAVIKSVRHARAEGLVEAILIGDRQSILGVLRSLDENVTDWAILPAEAGKEAEAAVGLIRDGGANVLMKGTPDTRDLLRPLVSRENNLRLGKTMSHVVFFDRVPGTSKLLVVTDGGMVLYPTLEEKKEIIQNAVWALRAIGYDCPKVAALSAIEKVNPRMIESVEAGLLREMNLNQEITNCVVEGPLSYDVAMSAEIAEHKGYFSENCGKFDVLIAPNMNCGNILGKCLTVTCGARMGGVIVGAKVPVVLTSRGSSAEEKFYSIALASLISSGAADGTGAAATV